MNASAIIPTKNEEKTIGVVINSVKSYVDEIIVVCAKSSTDRTLEIAKSSGVKIVIDEGQGKGEALRMGVKDATGESVVFIDADGSHIEEDIPKLLSPIEKGDADLVIASRMTGGSEELHGDVEQLIRLFASSMITLIINYRFNVRVSDSQNGFRAIKKDVFNKLNLKANIFDVETEMLMKCLKNGYVVSEIPSRELKRKFGKSGISIKKVWFRYVWRVFINLF